MRAMIGPKRTAADVTMAASHGSKMAEPAALSGIGLFAAASIGRVSQQPTEQQPRVSTRRPLAKQVTLASFQHAFSPLVVHCGGEPKHACRAARSQLIELQRRVQRITDEDRLQEAARLLKEADQRLLNEIRKQPG